MPAGSRRYNEAGSAAAALAGGGGLLGRTRSGGGGALGGGAPADAAALLGGRLVDALAAARPAFLAAAGHGVDGGPGAPLGFLLRHAAMLIALFDVLGLAFLLTGVFCLRSARHVSRSLAIEPRRLQRRSAARGSDKRDMAVSPRTKHTISG